MKLFVGILLAVGPVMLGCLTMSFFWKGDLTRGVSCGVGTIVAFVLAMFVWHAVTTPNTPDE